MDSLKMMICLCLLGMVSACSSGYSNPPTATADIQKTAEAVAAKMQKTVDASMSDMQATMNAEARAMDDLQETMRAYRPPSSPPPDIRDILPDVEATFEAETSGAAIKASKIALSEATGIPKKEITLVEIESITWPDTCMGVEQNGVECLPFQVLGFLVRLEADGEIYEYHTNLDGSTVVYKP